MRVRTLVLILSLAPLGLSCSDSLAERPDGGGSAFIWDIVTRVTGADNIQGIAKQDPYWGLYAYTPEGNLIFANARMSQKKYPVEDSYDYEYSNDSYKQSTFADGNPANTSSLGGMILSAYYPYRDELHENNFPPDDHDISARLTTNSLGHPAIHYGIPDYRVARHPVAYKVDKKGYFDYGPDAHPRYSYPARDTVLFSCYKYFDAESLTSGTPVKIDLAPTTCRIAFVFSVAPRFDANGNMNTVQQPDTTDYQIVSVQRLRKNIVESGTPRRHNTFNYDLKTGKITDMRFTDNQYFEFPVKPGDPGYNPSWGPVRPYRYQTDNDLKVPCVEFVAFPSVYDELQNIIFRIVYRYRLIRVADPLVEEDVWVTSTCEVSASSVYLVQGWRSGVIYRYHIYISRHEVDYDVQLIPWEFYPAEDQFFSDIQV